MISESRMLSRKLSDYGQQKSTALTTARRLSQLLGEDQVREAGLCCQFVVAREPADAPVSQRAIPTAIFKKDAIIRRRFLREWMGGQAIARHAGVLRGHGNTIGFGELTIRDVVDWSYYSERLTSTIQKIVTIPAASQGLTNPVQRVQQPDWLQRRLIARSDMFRQKKITDLFRPAERARAAALQNETVDDGIEVCTIA